MRRVQEAQREPEHGAVVFGRSGREDGALADTDIGARRERYEPDMFGGRSGNPEQAWMGGGDFDVADAVYTGPPRAGGDAQHESPFFKSRDDCREKTLADALCVGRQGSGALGRPSDSTAGDDGQASDAVNAGAGFWSGHRWAIGADGKARRVGSDFRRLVDGFSARVDGLRPGCYAEAEKEVMRYGQETATRPTEIMRAVWDRVLSKPTSYGSVGEQTGICSAEILLTFLCQLNRGSGQSDLPFSGSEELKAAMRSVRGRTRYARSSYQWGRDGQRPSQHSDALQALSWVLAQHAEAAWSAYRQTNAAPMALLAHNVPARVGKLKALGNAIVPQVAAEVIGAYLDAAP